VSLPPLTPHLTLRLIPYLTQARAALTQTIAAIDEFGETRSISIPAERALTVYVDKRELVTLMTLGAQPELLVLGYLRNQRLVRSVDEIESITVDWDVGEGLMEGSGVAAVKTRSGIAEIEARTAKKVVTTGCGQGSIFGELLDEIDAVQLPALSDAQITQAQLYSVVNTIRLKESTYKSAGSVHACALFAVGAVAMAQAKETPEMLMFVEDVGRHNAIDTIAGWLWMQEESQRSGANKLFYTTGRLTSEMVIKSAQMGVPLVVSRSGITQMGFQVAQALGLCAVGRATNRHFLCYSATERLLRQPSLASAAPALQIPSP
jgi:FdhD protein